MGNTFRFAGGVDAVEGVFGKFSPGWAVCITASLCLDTAREGRAMLEFAQSVATLAATATGVYVAISGLNAWKRETIGRRDLDLCQKVIELFYEAERNVSMLRSPFAHPSIEAKDRPKPDGESESESSLRDIAWVPIARWQSQGEFWAEFFSYRFRMRALFGERASEAFDIVDETLREFRAAASTRYGAIRGDRYDLETDLHRELDQAVWERSRSDPLAAKMAKAIAAMETVCIPIVRASKPFRLF
jgi:hypothetical protein